MTIHRPRLRTRYRVTRRHERGAVLIVAMIFLIIMTLLAVTGMTTTSLEEKMASNSQETSRAFQAAETGLSQALADANSYDLTSTYAVDLTQIADTELNSAYATDFLGVSAPPLVLNAPELLNSIDCYETANFNFRSTGTSVGGITAVVNGGAWQLKKTGKC